MDDGDITMDTSADGEGEVMSSSVDELAQLGRLLCSRQQINDDDDDEEDTEPQRFAEATAKHERKSSREKERGLRAASHRARGRPRRTGSWMPLVTTPRPSLSMSAT